MSSKKLLIIKFDKKDIVVGKVLDINNPVITDLQTFPWVEKTLEYTFKEIHSTYNISNVRIILRESLAHVISLPVDEKEIHSRENIKKHLAKHIPEIIDNLAWDYKKIDNLEIEEEGKVKNVIQVIASDKKLISNLHQSLEKTKFSIQAIEPISITLARLTQEEKDPIAIIHVDKKSTRLIAYRGIVLASQVEQTENFGKNLSQLISYTWNHFSIKPKKLILSNVPESLDHQNLATEHLEIIKYNYDPMIGIIEKSDLKGKDEDVLNLDPEQTHIEIKDTEHETKPSVLTIEPETIKENSFNIKKIIIIIVAIILLAALGMGIFIFKNNININESLEKTSVVNTPPPQITPPTPAPQVIVNRQDIKLQIQNGSGIVGIAGEFATLLEDHGYTDIDTANAEEYEYENITLKLKEAKKSYQEAILADIKAESKLEINEVESLPENSDFDAIIIIGK